MHSRAIPSPARMGLGREGSTYESSSSSNSLASSNSNLYEKPEHPPGSTESRNICCKAGSSRPLRMFSCTIRCAHRLWRILSIRSFSEPKGDHHRMRSHFSLHFTFAHRSVMMSPEEPSAAAAVERTRSKALKSGRRKSGAMPRCCRGEAATRLTNCSRSAIVLRCRRTSRRFCQHADCTSRNSYEYSSW